MRPKCVIQLCGSVRSQVCTSTASGLLASNMTRFTYTLADLHLRGHFQGCLLSGRIIYTNNAIQFRSTYHSAAHYFPHPHDISNTYQPHIKIESHDEAATVTLDRWLASTISLKSERPESHTFHRSQRCCVGYSPCRISTIYQCVKHIRCYFSNAGKFRHNHQIWDWVDPIRFGSDLSTL
jgi:hypothetical protein